MKKLAIIGATGSVGETLVETALQRDDVMLTLLSRDMTGIKAKDPRRERIITGDVFDKVVLDKVLIGQDVVVVAVDKNITAIAEAVVATMKRVKTTRLIFVASMGIYAESKTGATEVREKAPRQAYLDAMEIVENADLDFTILRPGLIDDEDENYQMIKDVDPASGRQVLRNSIAGVVMEIMAEPQNYRNEIIGIGCIE